MFQATGLCSHKQRPPIMHAYGGAKTGMAQALQSIASEGWLPLAAAMVGTSDKPPLWTDLRLRPVVGTTLDIKLEPCPLERREVALLLSCWKRWDPDCEDSPCYGIRKMNVLEVMRLFGECGFEFLPETDLQKRPGLEVVMTVGLHLCALEMTDQQVDTLACIALAGQLPEFFPLLEWSYAVKKSFMSQEVVTCANRDQWDEVCTMLQEVSNTELSLRSKNRTTLWTRANPCLPTPEDDAFPLQVLTPPPTRRTIAYQMFMAAHIAPSHRRPPHPVWEDSLSLIADLLFGSGVDRYVGAMQRADSPLEVNVRGFSAGSYSGLAFLHILWSIPRVTTKGCLGAIACPPALLSMS